MELKKLRKIHDTTLNKMDETTTAEQFHILLDGDWKKGFGLFVNKECIAAVMYEKYGNTNEITYRFASANQFDSIITKIQSELGKEDIILYKTSEYEDDLHVELKKNDFKATAEKQKDGTYNYLFRWSA